MSEINVVPYIDVMLVLLIIFMVTAPLLTQGIKVELPQAEAEAIEAVTAERSPLVISIDREGRLYLDQGQRAGEGADPQEPVDEPMLEARVAALLRQSPERAVLVKGDRAVAYGRVVETMVILQRAGAAKVGFLTDPPPARPVR
jgi:biopolymer transport protein TolR